MRRDGRTPSVGCTMVGLALLAAFVVGVFALDALTGGGSDAVDQTTTSLVDTVASTAPPSSRPVDAAAAVTPSLSEYAVTYRVETHSGQFLLVDTEVRRFRFPFEVEVLTFDGEPDDVVADGATAASERTVHVMGGFETGAPDQVPTVLAVVPGPPARSAHFGGDLARAVEEGLVRFTGTRLQVAGRECDVYRSGGPLDVTRLTPPTEQDHAELCIAADGLVLRESWTAGGTLFRTRTAVSVVEDAAEDEHFALRGYRIPDAAGGGRVRQLTADSTAPGVVHLLPATLPEGFASSGRFVYVADTADTGTGDVRIDRIVSLVDVYTADHHVLVIENGGSVEGGVSAETDGLPLDVVGHPEATGQVRTHLNSVFVPVDGRFVRLSSTLPLADLEALAGTLTDHQGTGQVTPLGDALDVTGRLAPQDRDG